MSLDLVLEFHRVYEQPVRDVPHVRDPQLNKLRIDLLREELDELEAALAAGDEVETLDALTDLQYVLDGAYLSLGFWKLKGAALDEVHASNLSKLGADGRPVYLPSGKVTKGPGYVRPDLVAVLARFYGEVTK